MNISDFDYNLPRELIAQFPLESRDESRLLIVERKTGCITDSRFKEIVNFLNSGDALVLNDTRVKPVRLTGALGSKQVDILLVERREKNLYLVKANPSSRLKPGIKINFEGGKLIALCPDQHKQSGMKLLKFETEKDIELKLDEIGLMPLPPYIKRQVCAEDRIRYQTVYASNPGAIASPTAGLHFTEKILDTLQKKKVEIIYLTLHVGLGTFSPLRESDISRHKMHAEHYLLTEAAAKRIENVSQAGRKICAVGTTTCRVLENCAKKENNSLKITAGSGMTDLFIYPPYEFKATDMLLTNFHLPRTTLLLLVSAFGGRELMMRVYEHAVREKYRFYSYGDCMLIV